MKEGQSREQATLPAANARHAPARWGAHVRRRVVALLRAVKVGGIKVPMSDLKRICIEAGFADAVFSTDRREAEVKAELERRLTAFVGRPGPRGGRCASAQRGRS